MRLLIASTILAMSLVGCASVPMAGDNADSSAKHFKSLPDQSRVYIYRNEYFGAGIKMLVLVDGKVIGKTAPHTYFSLDLTPGKHTLVTEAENTDTLKFETLPGKITYIHQTIKLGVVVARSKVSVVDSDEGQEGVMSCKMIETQLADN